MLPNKLGDQLDISDVSEILEMEMEEYDPFRDKYSEVTTKMEKLLKNFVLMKITNKRNELNILYLYQMLNNKNVNSEKFEEIFKDLDALFEDVNTSSYRYDELIAKNNELGKRINPLIGELLK